MPLLLNLQLVVCYIKKKISWKILGICEINTWRHRKCFVLFFFFFFFCKKPSLARTSLVRGTVCREQLLSKTNVIPAPHFLCPELYVLDSVLHTQCTSMYSQ